MYVGVQTKSTIIYYIIQFKYKQKVLLFLKLPTYIKIQLTAKSFGLNMNHKTMTEIPLKQQEQNSLLILYIF